MSDQFNLKDFMGSFNKPLMYTGSQNAYVAIAECPTSKLAMAIEVGTAMVPVHGLPTQVIGLGFRLVEVGQLTFGKLIGHRGGSGGMGTFKNSETGHMESGFRLIKNFIPLMTFPCDPAFFRAYTDKEAFPEMLLWLKDLCIKTSGKLLMTDDELLEALINSVSKFDEKPTEPQKLFTPPGTVAAWMDQPKPKPVSSPFGGVDQDGEPLGGPNDDADHEEDDE